MGIKLSTPRVKVVLGDPDDPDTWEETEVQTIGRDLQAVEELLGQLKRGAFGANPIAAQAMAGYFAMRRTGRIDAGMTWPEFEASYLEVADVAAEPVGPTPPAPGPESS